MERASALDWLNDFNSMEGMNMATTTGAANGDILNGLSGNGQDT
ncbi:hypothetical protein [Candidatus Accumulibacter vicinus]|uniref:Uncharacterized protein n=1 Tax=Candidatus Accumulibacter vicinus TaxID=2954382 RepID=A0A084Y5P5_9PROT|nr:hypothetical protein [Candidatus Accumulibacter vicinus]KFB70039.1 MAG: hypothetical protein CAPSK01_000438 [Candidatus Accumulibacter vicinus]